MIGESFSHYRIVEKLGSGGMGVLYKAEDTKLKRTVALKFLPPELTRDERAKDRFIREARAASALQHHNICTIHEIDETPDGRMFICMDYYAGETLKERIARGPLSVEEGLDIAVQLATGLARAHDAGIIHRDIKPANIMMTEDAVLKILDFGVAKPIGDAGVTKTGTLMGTIAYMSPEQARGDKVDHRSDVWSSGVVLYEMLTGRRPFRGDHDQAVVYSILNDESEPVTALRPDVPSELQRVVERMLAKDPEARYGSAKELLADLERCRREPRMARVGAPVPRKAVARLIRPRRWLLGAVVGVTALVAVLVGLWLGRPSTGPFRKSPTMKQRSVPSVAVLPFVDMSSEKNQQYFSDGLTEELINYLARIKGMRVTARTASFQFRDTNEDLRVIGQKLNVATILEGSVRREGQRVRVTAQLVKAADGFHLWSETYNENLDDIFSVQQNIARSVAMSLKVTLVGAAPPRNTSTEAYEAYLKARYSTKHPSKEGVERAIGYYEHAIELDPEYAPAWAGLAAARAYQGNLGWAPLEESYREARDNARRALRLDPESAEAHSIMGWIKMAHDWDWAGADTLFEKASALAPGDCVPVGYASMLACKFGRLQDAVELDHRAIELDPLSGRNYHMLGIHCYYAGRLDEAIAAFETALELTPDRPETHWMLGLVLLARSRPQEALAEMEKETYTGYRLHGMSLAYHALGRAKDADESLASLIADFRESMPSQIAEVYAARGQVDSTFAWLERAYALRDAGVSEIKASPLLRKFELDPRYAALAEKLGLTL